MIRENWFRWGTLRGGGGREWLRRYRTRLLLLLSVVGPGIITANVDNDAGGITTYSVAGAHFGYSMLFMLIFVTIALIVVQEMSARLGVITGKGLAALIRESMGVRAVVVILAVLILANIANTVSEFAGVAASLEIFGVSKYISVPLVAIGVRLLVVRGNYKSVEKVFLFASAIYLAYVLSGILARPPWGEVLKAATTPSFSFQPGYLVMFITIIGTTIAPWMQFYQQSSIADKGLKPEEFNYERVDVIVGCTFTDVVAAFIIIACAATLFVHGGQVNTAQDAAVALAPLAGKYASVLFAIGLLNASIFSAAILPLSTAYAVCEGMGWESTIDRGLKEAPVFFGIYTALIALGAGIILLPVPSLIQAMLDSQTLNGVLLPVILIVMLRLINDRRLMGRWVNGRVINGITWAVAVFVIALTVVLVGISVAPGLVPG